MGGENIHIGELIRYKLDENQRSIAWLSRKVHRDRSSLCKLLKKDSIDTKLLFDISTALQFDFFCYYSDKLHKPKMKQNEELFATK